MSLNINDENKKGAITIKDLKDILKDINKDFNITFTTYDEVVLLADIWDNKHADWIGREDGEVLLIEEEAYGYAYSMNVKDCLNRLNELPEDNYIVTTEYGHKYYFYNCYVIDSEEYGTVVYMG